MKRKQSTVEPGGKAPVGASAAREPAHPVSSPASGRDQPARAGARRLRTIPWKELAILLLAAALIASWGPAALDRWAARQYEQRKQALLLQLTSPAAFERAGAARDLQNFKEAAVAQALSACLQDSEWTVRYEALLALGQFVGDDQAAATVVPFLNDENPRLQDAAVAALKQLAAPRALEPLVQTYLRNERLRAAAKAALEAMNEPHTSEFLLAALSDPDAGVRAAAARGLSYWGRQNASGRLGPRVRDADAAVRQEAVLALGRIGSDFGLEPDQEALLAGAINDPDVGVRQSAVAALARLSVERNRAALLAAGRDPEPAVRAAAVTALKALPPSDAAAPLRKALTDPSPAVRSAALATLGDQKAVSALDAVIDRLSDTDVSVRTQAVRTLGALGDPNAVAPLKDALKTGAAPAYDVITALGALRAPEAVPVLLEQAHRDDHRLRFTALMALTKLNTPEVEQALKDFYYAETRPYVRSDLATAVEKMRAERK